MSTIGADSYLGSWKKGHLNRIDEIKPRSHELAGALQAYAKHTSGDGSSLHWQRSYRNIENILFMAGRQYHDDMMLSRIAQSSDRLDQSTVREVSRSLPKPVNDILGRYIETNVALLTENRPIPRCTAKSPDKRDRDAAELAELNIEYLWEALGMPEKQREIARIILTCGTAWMEVCWDPALPRHLAVPLMEPGKETVQPQSIPGAFPVRAQSSKMVPVRDEQGGLVYSEDVTYGEVNTRIVSPFEMHMPNVHSWNADELGWVMREEFVSKEALLDKYGPKRGLSLSKSEGWDVDAIKDAGTESIQTLPIWWWERICQMVEGNGPSIYIGDPTLWKDYVVVRTFDRKPSAKWPRGRTVIAVGDKVLYDSPKKVGARAYDPRWPRRWHPYVHFRWEAMTGSLLGRALVTKLLPQLKRVNQIDTSMIMYRRAAPVAAWLLPKGASPQEGMFSGRPGAVITWDPRMTQNNKPEAIFPQPLPKEFLEERMRMLEEMEVIAGTEEILRGQRPAGVNSAAMVNILRKQALASRSATLQYWDEGLQAIGGAFNMETIKHVKNDILYAERLRIIAREKSSRQTIATFSGTDLSDNVQIRVDTASMALVSREAEEAKAMDFLQYAANLINMPIQIRNVVLKKLNLDDALEPQSADIDRANLLVSLIKQGKYQDLIPYEVDDPYVFYQIFVDELKDETFMDLDINQQKMILAFIDAYKMQIEAREQQKMQQAMMMMQMQMAMKGGGGGAPQVGPGG
jgi:hypothetical protein